jgi:hypothetical protein
MWAGEADFPAALNARQFGRASAPTIPQRAQKLERSDPDHVAPFISR